MYVSVKTDYCGVLHVLCDRCVTTMFWGLSCGSEECLFGTQGWERSESQFQLIAVSVIIAHVFTCIG